MQLPNAKLALIRTYSYSRGVARLRLFHKPSRWRVHQTFLCRRSTDRRWMYTVACEPGESKENVRYSVQVHWCLPILLALHIALLHSQEQPQDDSLRFSASAASLVARSNHGRRCLTLLAEEKQRQHLDILARRLHSMCACRERSEGAFCHESSAVTGHKLHKRQMQTP